MPGLRRELHLPDACGSLSAKRPLSRIIKGVVGSSESSRGCARGTKARPRTAGSLAFGFLLSTSSLVLATAGAPNFAVLRASDPAQRMQYLATAAVWRDPGMLSPRTLLDGPPAMSPFPSMFDIANRPDGWPCTFERPGEALGGNTPKFLCRAPDGSAARIKYYDRTTKNREVFSLVATTRLMWALGFGADGVYPLIVNCLDCPEDPMTGRGRRAARRFLAVYQPRFKETTIVDGRDPNQGWSWREVDEAIRQLPQGVLGDQQRTHFDALTLVAVLVQHGDRKPEQQRLFCRDRIDADASSEEPLVSTDRQPRGQMVFFERPGRAACATPMITVQDVGATFGGAGKTTSPYTAKMNLVSWAKRAVFDPPHEGSPRGISECRGNLTVSVSAGSGAEAHPRIGEAGRLFLLRQLQRLGRDHLRAIFTAARVDSMDEAHRWRDPHNGKEYAGVDAWIAVLQDKVQQIQAQSCAP